MNDALALEARITAFVGARVPDSDVDDVVQDIYLRLVKSDAEVAHVSGFVHQVARSAIADYHRGRARDAALEASLPDAPVEPADDEAARTEVASWLGPLLDGLPERYAEAVRLVELDGLSHVDAARRLGVPRTTVTSRVRRGRELLEQALTRCCAIALDARGKVIGWTPREACCDESPSGEPSIVEERSGAEGGMGGR